ncbi:MAG: hypothetical protein ACOC1K_02095 [Nanoarchaeota archaeon]
MSISVNNLSKNLVLVFLLCLELKLDFDKVQVLFLTSDKVFWKYIHVLPPALRISFNRFYKLNELASLFYNNIDCTDKLDLLEPEEELLNKLKDRLTNKFECDGDLYKLDDFLDYIKFNNGKVKLDITLVDGRHIDYVTKKELVLYEGNILTIYMDNKEYNRTSSYEFNLKHKG